MEKLLAAYTAAPTDANARKVANHNRRHPFAAVMLVPADSATLAAALDHAKRVTMPPVLLECFQWF